ncbi:DUF397 domain-containing protein [Streptomyces sp. NPDC003719]
MTRTLAMPDATTWIRSSYSSSGDGNDCVEVAVTPVVVHVRDSKRPDGPRLVVSPAAWGGFLGGTGED